MPLKTFPHILLLGGGYTLERLAQCLDPGSFVITTRSKQRKKNFSRKKYASCLVDVDSEASLESVFAEFQDLNTLVDSVPPMADMRDPISGVQNICKVAKRAGIQRVLYLSTTGVYGIEDGSEVDEKLVPEPKHARSIARLAAEHEYRRHGFEFSALRLPAIYGPGRGIGIALAEERYKLIEDGSRWSNRIHVEDLVEVLRLLLKQPRGISMPPALNVSDDCPALASEIVTYYCERFRLPFPASISLAEAEQQGMYSLLSNQKIKNGLLKQTVDIQLKYPSYSEGAGTEF